jgi:hypothetical protein
MHPKYGMFPCGRQNVKFALSRTIAYIHSVSLVLPDAQTGSTVLGFINCLVLLICTWWKSHTAAVIGWHAMSDVNNYRQLIVVSSYDCACCRFQRSWCCRTEHRPYKVTSHFITTGFNNCLFLQVRSDGDTDFYWEIFINCTFIIMV